ncbi:hypothetical protein KAR04_09545 [Candidatus Calescamantes bacterium]|nr:hypothetical protein [Candidatus Calescamantes bacterium]MCK5600046.1 hypothetical protein [bacterium]
MRKGADMDIENDNQLLTESSEDRNARVNRLLGFLLIGIGIALGIWVFSNLIGMIKSPEKVGLVDYFQSEMVSRIKTQDTGRVDISIPENFRVGIGIFAFIILLSIAAGFAKTLISAGVKLLLKADSKMLQGMRNDIARLRELIELRR